ncbi:hypothetical protein HS141_07915 [Cetobacterium somerae]|uniref:YjcQ family protein n=1 Tax=Cetobacterium somerae TaxID=188913 RepID=UPI00211DBA82|nr:YjcQ family protein [Cetobacterium somerae]MCQ9626879.1 hypothetical protein [Cetobacterium somerae]
MDFEKLCYQVLKRINDHSATNLHFKESEILNPSNLNSDITQIRYAIKALKEEGLIEGLSIQISCDGCCVTLSQNGEPRLTLKGHRYLKENSFLNKTLSTVKDILISKI